MNKYLVAGVLLGLSATAMAAPGRAGLAQAKSEFSIHRDGDALIQAANRVAEVRSGDMIEAVSDPVLVDTANGVSMLVGPNSLTSFDENQNLVLQNGIVAVAVEKDEKMIVSFKDLAIQPTELTADSKSNRSVFVTKTNPGDSIIVQAAENSVSVKNTETGEQIAFVGSGDTIMLIREEAGWRATAVGQGQPFGGFRMQDPTATETESAAEDDDDDDRGGWLWWGAAGVGAAGLAGLIYYYEHQDDEDDQHRDRKKRKNDDDEERPCLSPPCRFTPPPTENPT